MTIPDSLSKWAHPPRSNTPRSSSSGPPGPCITPSTETCVVVVSFMVATPSLLSVSLVGWSQRAPRPALGKEGIDWLQAPIRCTLNDQNVKGAVDVPQGLRRVALCHEGERGSAGPPLEPADADAGENDRVSGARRQRQPRVAVPARWV